jgi:membrane fusion protein, multidrug efflux system
MKRRNKQVTAVLALAVVVAVVLVIVLSNGSSPNGASGQTPSYSGTASVQRRNLVSTDTESGTLSYANPQTVYNRLSGTITWLPAVGQLIKPGHALFDIDNSPVLLMNGPRPAFRDLTASDSDGPDILELNRNLVDLGYDPDGIVIDDEWQAATTAGVEALQTAEGWDETGTLSLGQIVFLPGSQLIATVAGTVGSTGGGSEASLSDPLSHAEFVDATTTSTDTTTTGTSTSTTGTTTATGTTTTGTTTTGTTTTGTTTTGTSGTATTLTKTPGKKTPTTSGTSSTRALARELAELKAELTTVKAELKAAAKADKPSGSGTSGSGTSGSGTSGSGSGASGSGASGSGTSGSGSGGGTTEILTTNSTQLVVTVDLNASLQSEATLGEKVLVEMPDGSTVGGKVTAVSSVAQSSDSGDDGSGGGGSGGSGGSGSSGSSATVPITITLDKRAKGAGLDQASVSVNFTQAKANNVLSIPVTALIATSGQKFAVQEAAAPYKLIPVTTGLFAAGDVQISGSGVYQGLKITDSQG